MGSARPADVRPPIVELSLRVDLLRLARPSGKGAAFKALDDADADTTTRSEKLLLGLLALTAEFETEIKGATDRGYRQGAASGTKFGRKLLVTPEKADEVKAMLKTMTVSEIIKVTGLRRRRPRSAKRSASAFWAGPALYCVVRVLDKGSLFTTGGGFHLPVSASDFGA